MVDYRIVMYALQEDDWGMDSIVLTDTRTNAEVPYAHLRFCSNCEPGRPPSECWVDVEVNGKRHHLLLETSDLPRPNRTGADMSDSKKKKDATPPAATATMKIGFDTEEFGQNLTELKTTAIRMEFAADKLQLAAAQVRNATMLPVTGARLYLVKFPDGIAATEIPVLAGSIPRAIDLAVSYVNEGIESKRDEINASLDFSVNEKTRLLGELVDVTRKSVERAGLRYLDVVVLKN